MDRSDELLNEFEAREQAERKLRKAAEQRIEAAARAAHKVRQTYALLQDRSLPEWDDISLTSQRHLLADAQLVAANPKITAKELHRLYQERLLAAGDTDNVDLEKDSPQEEEAVLMCLKEMLTD